MGHGVERVDQIIFNPMNWRFHPTEQRRALQGLMRDVGMVQEVVKNLTTGNLIDGHLRVLIADEEGMGEIHCSYVEMTEQEELLYLIANDRIGGMAATDKETGRPKPGHHPFTRPNPDDLHLFESEPMRVRSIAYDLVLNGWELGSGSIRIHRADLQERVFRVLGISAEEARATSSE